MPRYFFHTADGIRVRDTVGIELSGHAAARVQAIELTGRLLSDEPDYLSDGHDFRVEVTDRAGSLLFTILTMAINAPASGINN